jgi:hypothetical protein
MDEVDSQDTWKDARRKLLYDEVVCLIKRCSVNLLSFDEVRKGLHLRQRVPRGLQEVTVSAIRGSVGRYDDFSAAFLPRKEHLRDRWVRVDLAMKAGKTPPVELYKVGDVYFVMDGNHRVSSARLRGVPTIEAYVTEFITPVALSADVNIDELLIKEEQAAFLEQTARKNRQAAQAMAFTCSGCYSVVAEQVERYRQGMETLQDAPMSSDDAFERWHEEVYDPAIEAIRRNNLLEQFPGRTEGDLFIWAQQNGAEIEVLEVEGSKG